LKSRLQTIVGFVKKTTKKPTILNTLPAVNLLKTSWKKLILDTIDSKKRSYEVRLGSEGKFSQKAYGDDYLIGKFNRFEGNTAFYTGGVHCGATGKDREGTVELIEDTSLTEIKVSFAEIDTCVYKTVIAVPKLCDSCMTIDDFIQETIAGHDPRKRFFYDVQLGAGASYNQ
jgi:hypothetical protein